MARGDVCAYLHHWLRGRLALPEADYRGIMHELLHILTQLLRQSLDSL